MIEPLQSKCQSLDNQVIVLQSEIDNLKQSNQELEQHKRFFASSYQEVQQELEKA